MGYVGPISLEETGEDASDSLMNMLKTKIKKRATAVLVFFCAALSQAGLIAHYDFSDGELLDNEVGAAYTLRMMKSDEASLREVRLNSLEGTAVFPGGGPQAPWLEVVEGGNPDLFTVSFWFRTDCVRQVERYALFSSNTEYFPGNWMLYSSAARGGGLDLLGRRETQRPMIPPHTPNVWHHAVVRKIRDGEKVRLEMVVTPLGGRVGEPLLSVSGFEATLKRFMLGKNPNRTLAYRMELANVKIFDDAEVPVESLFSEGPQVIRIGSGGLNPPRKKVVQLEVEADRLRAQLTGLPQIDDSLQLDAYGYHSGYLPALDELPEEPRWVVEVDASLEHSFNELYLVPVADRRFEEMPGYGFPRRFRIMAVNAEGEEHIVADWRDRDYPDPGRFPARFFGAGWSLRKIRLEVFRGQVEGGREFFALDEVLVRADYFVIQADAVKTSNSFESPPFWSADYLIDQKTSLGLPTLTANGESLTYYIRRFPIPSVEPLTVELDLGKNRSVDMITLYPSRPPEGVIVPGYGFPGSVRIHMFGEMADGERKQRRRIQSPILLNPGNNVIRFPGHSLDVRWVQLTFDDLPLHEGLPTFGMGEIALTGPVAELSVVDLFS